MPKALPQAVLDHKTAVPNWISYENSHIEFMQSKEGSIKHRIWLKAKANCPVNIADCLAPLGKGNAVTYMKKIIDQQIVIISGDFANSIAHAGMCPLAHELSPNPMILRIDPNEEAVPMGIGYNKLLDQSMPDVAKTVTIRGRRTQESGIIPKLLIPTRSPSMPCHFPLAPHSLAIVPTGKDLGLPPLTSAERMSDVGFVNSHPHVASLDFSHHPSSPGTMPPSTATSLVSFRAFAGSSPCPRSSGSGASCSSANALRVAAYIQSLAIVDIDQRYPRPQW